MEKNLTRHADSRIPGNGVILSRFKFIPMDWDRIPRFHENSMKTAVSLGLALRHRQLTNTHQSQ
jgi:hypothetical protein